MPSTRTLYIKKKVDAIDRILMAVVRLARLKGSQIEKIPMPTLKLILMLVENPMTALGRSRLNKLTEVGRKNSISYFSKTLGVKTENEEIELKPFTPKKRKLPSDPDQMAESDSEK